MKLKYIPPKKLKVLTGMFFGAGALGRTITKRFKVKIIEGNKERVQFYEGTILAKKNSSINTTITVRKILQGIGIERIFLIHSPKVDSINVLIL